MQRNGISKLFILASLPLSMLISCQNDHNTVAETSPNTIQNYSFYDIPLTGYNPEYRTQMSLAFYDINYLPYVSVIDYLHEFTGINYSVSHKNDVFTFTNPLWNYGSYKPKAYFDMKTQTLKYDDYACFISINPYAHNPLDLVAADATYITNPITGDAHQLMSYTDGQYIAGSSTEINVKSTYKIDSYVYQNKLYMPLYTVKTLFTSNYVSSYFFNGKAVYEQVPNTTDSDYSTYLSYVKKGNIFSNITSDYLEYNYNQMILELDLRFGMGGLTRKNRIGTTTTYKTGLNNSCAQWLSEYKSELLSLTTYDDALNKIYASTELDDGGHTGIYSYSYNHAATDSENPPFDRGEENDYLTESYYNIMNARSKSYTEMVGYNSDISSFILRDSGFDLYMLTNLFYLCKYQNDYSYKNYTIDLSCNGGGYIFMQHLLNQFLSQGKSYNYFYCSVNGSKGSVKYKIDTNLDGVKNQSTDFVINNSNISIICSNFTFSAANATAFYAAEQSNVTIKGERTGGGACAVDSTVMSALGAGFQISSPYRLTDSNWNDDDYGVAPTKTEYSWGSHDKSTTEYKKFSSYDNKYKPFTE